MTTTHHKGPVYSTNGYKTDTNTVLNSELATLGGITASTAEINAAATGILATTTEVNLNNTLNAANVQTITAAGANTLTLTKRIHKIDTTLGAQTCTPAVPGAANLGVIHYIEMTVDGGTDMVFTQTNMLDATGNSLAGTSITFNDVGDMVMMVGGVSKWHIIATKGCTFA